jgi:N utilization substance protein A
LPKTLCLRGSSHLTTLSVIEPDQLAEMSGLSAEDCDRIVEYADVESARIEVEERIAAEQRKQSANAPVRQKSPRVTEEDEVGTTAQGAGEEEAAVEGGVLENAVVEESDLPHAAGDVQSSEPEEATIPATAEKNSAGADEVV